MEVNVRRTLPFVPGVVGLVLGIVAVAADLPVLGLAAGGCALLAAVAAWQPSPAPAPVAAEPPAVPEPVAEPAPAASAAPATPAPVAPADTGEGATFVDAETGLFNEEYFRVAVETRVLAARRHLRPVAVVLFDVVVDDGFGRQVPAEAGPVADAIRETLREADTACRLADGRFGFVLEDTPEDGAIWTVERLRRALAAVDDAQTRWAGIACYPAHAFSAEEVLEKAEAAYRQARDWAQDRIEVALPD